MKPVMRAEAEEHAQRLAVLIDADNAQVAVFEGLPAEVARFGETRVKRISGDFTGLALRIRDYDGPREARRQSTRTRRL